MSNGRFAKWFTSPLFYAAVGSTIAASWLELPDLAGYTGAVAIASPYIEPPLAMLPDITQSVEKVLTIMVMGVDAVSAGITSTVNVLSNIF